MIKKIASAVVLTLAVSSCSTIRYRQIKLPLPPRLPLTQLNDKEFDCLTPYSYRDMATRDMDHILYEMRLEAVIKSTWGD
jgi:hypothetical protein